MYYNSEDKQGFLKGELRGLRDARDSAVAVSEFARRAWDREEARLSASASPERDYRDSPAYAARERFRVAHREAVKLKDEVAEVEYDLGLEDDGYGDLDEYGYAA